MGNLCNKQAEPQSNEQQPQIKMPKTTKKMFLLHKSDLKQSEIVKHFGDALPNGSVDVKYFKNYEVVKDLQPLSLEWLNGLNNVLLIHLTSETIEEMGKIIREKNLADEKGYLHEKLFTVTFGEKLTGWPPEQFKRRPSATRDFHFGFPNIETLKTRSFKNSEKMTVLVPAIKGTN